jgi:hypothetical protein
MYSKIPECNNKCDLIHLKIYNNSLYNTNCGFTFGHIITKNIFTIYFRMHYYQVLRLHDASLEDYFAIYQPQCPIGPVFKCCSQSFHVGIRVARVPLPLGVSKIFVSASLIESMLNYYHKCETMLQYFTNNQRRFVWLCAHIMVMIFALVTSLAYCYSSGVGNQWWTSLYHINNAAAIIHAHVNSMRSMNANARLFVKAGVCWEWQVYIGFALFKCSNLKHIRDTHRSCYHMWHHTRQYFPVDVAGLIIVELKFAAHAYDFYGRVPVQRRIKNATPVAQLNQPVTNTLVMPTRRWQ